MSFYHNLWFYVLLIGVLFVILAWMITVMREGEAKNFEKFLTIVGVIFIIIGLLLLLFHLIPETDPIYDHCAPLVCQPLIPTIHEDAICDPIDHQILRTAAIHHEVTHLEPIHHEVEHLEPIHHEVTHLEPRYHGSAYFTHPVYP